MQTTINIPKSAAETLREIIPDISDEKVGEVFTAFVNAKFEDEENYCQPTSFDLWLESDDAEDVLRNYSK